LGTAPGATPARLIEHTMGGSNNRSQPELSTLLGTGSFYFALTVRWVAEYYRQVVKAGGHGDSRSVPTASGESDWHFGKRRCPPSAGS
jgi:hypothetical protein